MSTKAVNANCRWSLSAIEDRLDREHEAAVAAYKAEQPRSGSPVTRIFIGVLVVAFLLCLYSLSCFEKWIRAMKKGQEGAGVGGGAAKVVVLLMATDAGHPGLINAVDTLKKSGFEYNILGVGEKWGGWRHRMQSYRDAAAKIAASGPAALAVCMDAYDALAVRPNSPNSRQTLQTIFSGFGKPLVLSLEQECMGNCLPIKDWWNHEGQKYLINGVPPKERYVNGGLVIGYAWAVADLYNWMLENGFEDDQIGLAKYALAHPRGWVPDVDGKIFRNRVYGAQIGKEDLDGRGCFFAHYPGMRDWNGTAYDETVRKILKRESGVKSKNMGSPTLLALHIVAIAVVCVAFLITFWLIAPDHLKPAPLRNAADKILHKFFPSLFGQQ